MTRDRSKVIILKDKRHLGYAEYGASDGLPLFVFHGSPGSRLLFEIEDDVAIDLNLRMISVDRPGYGLSDRQKNRTFRDWPLDLLELASHLQIDKFGVAGISGGAPYAIACAEMIPEKLRGVFLISPPSWINMSNHKEKMNRINRIGFTLSKSCPVILSLLYKAMNVRSKKVNDVQLIEAFRQGVKESVIETRMITEPWGINFAQVNAPISIWHGEDDDSAPLGGAKWLSTKLSNSEIHIVKAGHSLYWDESYRKMIYTEFINGYNKEQNKSKEI
ncbi:Proline iminopeptidase [compost metagenome]